MGSAIPSDETMIHILMMSFPAQGHVNPLLRLAKRLAHSGMLVTLSAPEHMGQSIRRANNIADGVPNPLGRGAIRFEFFDDGWSLDDPKRSDLDLYMAQLEVSGRDNLARIIGEHEKTGRPVSCLINNPFIPWVSDVAESLGIPSAMLWVQSCASFSAYYHFYHNLAAFPDENEPKIDVNLPFMPILKYDEIPSFLHPTTPYSFLKRAILGQFKNLSKPCCVLMDTFQELEHEIVAHMSKIFRSIKTIGPLCRDLESSNETIRVDFLAPDDCTEFLDSKNVGSVVYISFGSVVNLQQKQIDEIAYGLLSSGLSFLWVLRPPAHVLPEGFLEEAGDRGKVVPWSQQEQVLAHRSTACFVTHCGWNSTVEALASGVPVVAFPQWGDQVTDAKFLVDVFKVGVRLGRGEAEGRVVPREEVERCLREAAGGGDKAAEMRKNAEKWKKLAAEAVGEGGSSYRNMQEFVNEIVRMKGTPDQKSN